MHTIEVVVPEPKIHGSDLNLLHYLEAMTYTFERDGQPVSCVLVYAEPDPDHHGLFHCIVARETGHEGIACVDDTARAALLALKIYERSREPQALHVARRWLSFVEYMQYPDGSFANFIRNAAGIRNASGPTSRRGGYWWSSRALWALARAYRITGEEAYRDHFQACRLAPMPDGKINALLALAKLEMYRAERSAALREEILEHCRLVIGPPNAPYFRDAPGSNDLMLWGYHQLHAVAEAARILDAPELLGPARRTVRNLVAPAVAARFWYDYPRRSKAGVCAYNVTPLVQGLYAMYQATGEGQYRNLALDGAAWFYGRNDAHEPLYDPNTGRCRDGINDAIVSLHCGAESAIEAGLCELVRRTLLHQ